MANNVIKTSFGELDTSSAPIYANQFGDGSTYGLDMTIGGTAYKYVPKDLVQNGGKISGDNAYFLPWLANADNLKTFSNNASLVDLGDVSFANYLKNNDIGTQGYLVKADAVPFDSQVTTQPAKDLGGSLTGLKNKNGEIVIGLSGGGGSRYLNQAGEVHNPTVTYHSVLGDIFGGAGETFSNAFNEGLSAINSLGPIGTAAISAVSPVAGAAIAGANTGEAIGSGASLSSVAPSLAASYAGSQLGGTVGADYGQAAGQVAGGTAAGLLRGQDFGSSLSSAALNVGANQAAGGLMNAANPSTSGIDYSVAPTSTGGGLGLKGSLAASDSSNPYGLGVSGGGGLGFTGSLGGLDFANLFGFNTTQGSGQGIQVPTQEGATLGSIGSEATSQNNPATQNLLGKLLLAGLTGNTTGTTNMATNNNLLGQLLGSGLTSAGGLMQGSTTAAAQQAQADALRQAGQLASQQAQFRPVGTTTTFGTSNFQVDPTTGQLTSAGYTLSPQLQAYQDQIMGANRQSLNDAATLQNLGRGYLAQSPEQAAQQWMTNQQALLQPGRDMESARLANQLQQTGRTGVSVAQGGALGAANPEQQALANARAMQDLQLAAQAQQQGQAQTTFGQGLLSSAYQPFNAGLTTASNVEQLGQQPLGLSSGLAQQSSAAGAKAGQLQLGANQAAAQAQLGAANYNPYASALSGLGGSSLFGNALGNLAGSTGVGQAFGNWLGSLGGYDMNQLGAAANDYANANPDVIPSWTIENTYNPTDSMDPELRKMLGL